MMDFKVRLLDGEDAAQFRELRHEALQKHPEAFGASFDDEKNLTAEDYAEWFEKRFFLGAFEGLNLVGMVGLLVSSHQKLAHKGTVIAVYVQEESRRKGIAKALMEALIVVAKERGVEQLQLSPVTTNEAAIHLYRSLGFEDFGVEKEALKVEDRYHDELHMVKFLE